MKSVPRSAVTFALLLLALEAVTGWDSAHASYSLLTTIAAGARTAAIIAVDVNLDNLLDIVATNQGAGTISVALGEGGGHFKPAVSYPTSTVGPYETVAADFNGDGYPDLAAGNFGASSGASYGLTVSVFLNNGDGTFASFVDYYATAATTDKVRAVATGDFNRDGRADIVVAAQQTGLHILLGNGDGTFQPQVLYAAGSSVHGVVVADFNQDGKADVALANNSTSGKVNVLFGQGNGTFAATTAYAAGSGTFGLAAGDLNGDGYPDIVTANNTDGTITVLMNLGPTNPGKFAAPVAYPATTKSVAVSLGDLNGDNRLDILSSADSGGVTDVYLNQGDGTFSTAGSVATGSGSYGSVVADFNADGIADFACARTNGTVLIMAAAYVDTDGDGIPDAWETSHGSNPNAPDSALDTDADGGSNLDEYRAGTDPQSAAARFAITHTAHPASGELDVTWTTALGKLYRIMGSSDLVTWTLLTPLARAATSGSRTVAITTGGALRFFVRVEIAPTP